MCSAVAKNLSCALLLLSLLGVASSLRAQQSATRDNLLHPYVGAATTIPPFFGFALEGGLVYAQFYAGIQIGDRAPEPPAPVGVDFLPRYSPYYQSNGSMLLYGIHAGIFPLKNGILGIGLVVLKGTQEFNYFFPTSYPNYGSTIETRYNFSIGPDIRLRPGQHLMINLAYTMQMGVKVGVDYVL